MILFPFLDHKLRSARPSEWDPRAYIIKTFVFTVFVIVTGCQSISDIDTAALEAELVEKQAVENRKAGIDTVGSGPTQIVFILDSQSGDRQTQFKNGAILAMKDLGESELTLLIADSETQPDLAITIRNSKPDLIAFSPELNRKRSTTDTLKRIDVPVIALGYSNSTKIFSFIPNKLDSLIAGLRHAAGGKKKRVVLVVPKEQASLAKARITKALGSSIHLQRTVAYDPANQSVGFSDKNLGLLDRVDVVAFAGSDPRVSIMAAQLRKQGSGLEDVTHVGNSSWPPVFVQSNSHAGTIIAIRDKTGMSLIEKQYRKAYAEPLNQSAAFAYDVVAVVAGIVRKNGKPGISHQSLRNPSGFRGATGLFRFHDKGRVERLYQIAMIEDGKLRVIDEGQAGF